MTTLRALGIASVWAAVGASLAIAIATSFSSIAGYQAFNVLSGSMEPALRVGSVVIDERIGALEARPGDILTFPDPHNRRRLITHRLKDISIGERSISMTTQGDANDVPERWEVPVGGELGRVAFHLPAVGYARAWLAGPAGRVLVLLALLAWGTMAVIDIWRPERSEAAGPQRGVA